MKLIVKETLEQGLSRKQGGMLKLRAGTYELTPGTEGNYTVQVDGKNRTISHDLIARFKELSLATTE